MRRGIDEPGSPVAARVEGVPSRAVLVVSSPSWVVVSESIDYQVPDRLVGLDHELLSHRDEQNVRDEPSAGEVFSREVLGLLDRFPVVKPVAEDPGASLPLSRTANPQVSAPRHRPRLNRGPTQGRRDYPGDRRRPQGGVPTLTGAGRHLDSGARWLLLPAPRQGTSNGLAYASALK
jgi:hypothetical protein